MSHLCDCVEKPYNVSQHPELELQAGCVQLLGMMKALFHCMALVLTPVCMGLRLNLLTSSECAKSPAPRSSFLHLTFLFWLPLLQFVCCVHTLVVVLLASDSLPVSIFSLVLPACVIKVEVMSSNTDFSQCCYLSYNHI